MAKELLLVAVLVVAVCSAAAAQTASEFPPGFYKDVIVQVMCSLGTDAAIVSVVPSGSRPGVQTLGKCELALQAFGVLPSAPFPPFRVTYGVPTDGTPTGIGLYWIDFSYIVYPQDAGGLPIPRPRTVPIMRIPIALSGLKKLNPLDTMFSGGDPILLRLHLITVNSPDGRSKQFQAYYFNVNVGRSHWVPISV